jgi:hypothetical protein
LLAKKLSERAGFRRNAGLGGTRGPPRLRFDKSGECGPPGPSLAYELTTRGARRPAGHDQISLGKSYLAQQQSCLSQVQRAPVHLQARHADLDLQASLGEQPRGQEQLGTVD